MAGRLQFAVQFGEAPRPSAAELNPDRPMRILVLGDFSGRGTRAQAADAGPLGSRPTPRIDIDNFETTFQRFAPRLDLAFDGDAAPVAPEFRTLEDFHPDQLFAREPGFQELAQLRARLKNPATFADAAAELRTRFGMGRDDSALKPRQPAPMPAAENEADLLDDILSGQSAQTSRESTGPLQEFIRRAVEPHVVPSVSPQQDDLIAAVDQAIGARMRAILHHPAFQRLEALWRGVDRLVAQIGSSEEVRLHLADITREELADDLERAGERPQSAGVYRLLVDGGIGTPGGEPWSLVIGDYTFGPIDADARLLAALGSISTRAGGPFLAAADSRILGGKTSIETLDPRDWPPLTSDEEELWTSLRHTAAAESIGLVWPRVLLRLPYGRETDEVERFKFEEITDPVRQHDAYLWGNPALACAQLLAQSFVEQSWSMRPGDNLELDGLPAHSYRNEHGEPELKPCAEIFLTQTAAEAILDRGLMPLASYRHRDAVRLVRFQSIALPPAPLRGAWQ